MALPEFQLLRPKSVIEAIELLARHSQPSEVGPDGDAVQIIAGGTDLVPSLRQRLFAPRYVLDIRGIDELRGIRMLDGGAEIGALVTLSRIEDSEFILRTYPLLRKASMTVASPILRNMGTVGGNLCLDTRCLWYNQSYAWRKSCGFCIKKDGELCHVAPGGTKCWATFSGDTAPALLCLSAEIEIVSPRGTRRLPLKDFYTGEGDRRMRLKKDELLTRVFLPESTAGWRGAYHKLRIRGSIDYPLAGVAVAIKADTRGPVQDARVAITAVNPAPMLVEGAEHALIGRGVDDHVAEVVGELAARTARPLTTSVLTPEYRREMIRVFTRRAVLEAARS